MCPDWLNDSRTQFFKLSQRLPHAILIHGEAGIGKHLLAMEIVAALICDSPDTQSGVLLACGQCKRRNYTTKKNKKNTPDKLEFKKYCRFCLTHTLHKETK